MNLEKYLSQKKLEDLIRQWAKNEVRTAKTKMSKTKWFDLVQDKAKALVEQHEIDLPEGEVWVVARNTALWNWAHSS